MDAMKISNVTKSFTVLDQVLATDFEKIATLDFTTTLCYSPKGESADQPNYTEISKATEKFKLIAYYLPVISGKISDGLIR